MIITTRNRAPFWLKQGWVRLALLVTSTLILAAVVVVLFGHELGRHIHSMESWVTQSGALGLLVFVGLVVVGTSLFVPESLFGIAAGVLFGLAWGVVIILMANILAATLQYGLAHRMLREPIRRKMEGGRVFAVIQRVASGDNLGLQVLLRLAPLNQTVISYSMGASGIRFAPFLAASIAMLPSIIFEVYLGHTGKHLALISVGAGHHGWRHGAILVVGLIVVVIGVGFTSRVASKSLLGKEKVSG